MKKGKNERIIKKYKDLTSAEKAEMLSFIKGFGNPLAPNTLEKMDSYYNSPGFNHGESHYSFWEKGDIVSCLGYVDKEIPLKKEAYMASVYFKEGHEETLVNLYGAALGQSTFKSDFTVKLGLYHSMKAPVEFLREKEFNEEYHLLEMSFDLKKAWGEDREAFREILEYELAGKENIERFLQIHNDAFLHSPNGSIMEPEEGEELLDEKKDMPWQLLLMKEDGEPVAMAILKVKEKTGTIEGVAVDPRWEGKGLGRKAVWTALKVMAEHGMETACLEVMDSNPRAHHLYKKIGFLEKKIHSDWYTKKIEVAGKSKAQLENPKLENFLDSEGRLCSWPMNKEIRKEALKYIAERFEIGKTYSELQVNGVIQQWHTFNDLFILRREMVDQKFLMRTRDGAQYWRGKKVFVQ